LRDLEAKRMGITVKHVAWAAMTLVLLSGCGQKGPLYLPDKKGSVVKPVTASPDVATPPEKTDPDQQDDSQAPHTP
jgi:predicted small lipoprotein YifL